MTTKQIRPQPRQEQFLATSADIAIFGGAAGGGKTYSVLIEPLRHVSNPRFGAVAFRRTRPEITNEGAMWDEAMAMYPKLGAKPNLNDLQFKFPSGAKITFDSMQYEDDKYSWDGAQVPLLIFDQLESFTAGQFFYMLSRNRSTCGVIPYVRATCNPEPGWLADFLAWWIGDDGYAISERSGVLRWMVRLSDDQIAWYNSREEAKTAHPDTEPLSVTFILSTVYDNQELLRQNPQYLANLKALSLVDRERKLGDGQRGGNWKVKPSAGKVFNRNWFRTVTFVPDGGQSVRRFDFAATEKALKKSDPDFTASCWMKIVDKAIYIMDVTAVQIGPAQIDGEVERITQQDKKLLEEMNKPKSEAEPRPQTQYKVRWEEEGGSSGKMVSYKFVQNLAGFDARGVRSSQDKITRAQPLSAQAEAGNVYLVEGSWNEAFLTHMHGQPDLPHDDIMDAASGAYRDLTAPEEQAVQYAPSIW